MTPSRADLIAAAWSASSWQFPAGYTADDFTAAVADWEFWPVVVGGELAGAFMVKDCEMHACIKPEYFKKWATPGLYRKVMRHHQKCGRITTMVHTAYDAGHEFVKRFGFVVYGVVGDAVLYELR